MNKPLLGLLLGGLLGVIDGMTAWFTPEVRNQMMGIVIGSTIKGMIAGFAAGWFARKVNNVLAGIAFGFAVGLLLAYAVAAMPSETGEHYYFEIMLPGSILGAVVGWATQRYGKARQPRPATTRAAAIMLAIALAAPGFGGDVQQHGLAAGDAFARLKKLAGDWEGNIMTKDGPTAGVTYAVTSGGNAVLERLFTGTEHEMVTVYYVEGNELLGTHYCAMGNQPRFKFNETKSSATLLVFDFAGVTGLKTADEEHIHNGSIALLDNGQVEATWSSREGEPRKFYLKRK